jgi:choice-of-anchor B domain-containing protein
MRRSTLLALALAVAVATGAQAQVHPPENVVLLKNIDRGENYAGNWGYTSPSGVELAISGTRSGTTFINATNPATAAEVAFIPGPISTWREIATYGQYAYVVTEEPGAALQVVSLANPLAPVLVATLNPPAFPYATAHEIKADPTTGFLYVCGTSPGTGQPDRGMVILDAAANPTDPVLRGQWTTNYVHDISIQSGKAYAASIYDGIVYVLNVANPPPAPPWSPPVIVQWTYPSASTHNTWPSEDDDHLVTTDEVTGHTLRMWDISNLPAAPQQTAEFASPNGAIVHNAYLRGNLCYVAWYRDGFRVFDVTDPSSLQSVGWYDTHPSDGADYQGAWGCYPFATDPTIVYISDIQTGTYILQFNDQIGTLSGTVRNASTSVPIAGAQVVVEGTNITLTTGANGTYSTSVASGTYTVDCTAFGYTPGQAQVTITTGQTSTLNFNLAPLPAGGLSGVVQSATQTLLAGATVTIEDTPFSTTTNVNGVYSFASVPAGNYDVTAEKFGYASQTSAVSVVAAQQNTRDFTLQPAFYAADMETSPGTWAVSGNATAGQWVRVDPNGTSSGGVPMQPENDHTPAPGVMCWVTGQGAVGGQIGDADVDNGSTILTTHVIDLSTLNDPELNYYRWFVNDGNGSVDDPWVVEVSSNSGTTWVAIENTFTADHSWKSIGVRLGDYLTLPITQFRVRFTARDISPGSIVEAGVDDFQIFDRGSTTGVDPGASPGVTTVLRGNFPNPFNPTTAIRYDLAAGGPVKLRIYDAGGRLVRVLYDGPQAAGPQAITWDGRNDGAAPVASGVYFYRLEAPGYEAESRMVLSK